MNSPVFQLNVDKLGSGWVRFTLTSESAVFSDSCSYIDDSLTALARFAADLASNRGVRSDPACIHWFDEPGAYEWQISVDDAAMLTLVVCRCREAFPKPEHVRKEVFRGTIHARSFCVAILRSFDEMLHVHGRDGYESEWRRPFPMGTIDRLRDALGNW